MRSLRTHAVCLMGLLVLTGTLEAAGPELESVAALRKQKMYDEALLQLEQLEQAGDTPADVRAVIPFERAVTLLELAATQTEPEEQQQLASRADAALDSFLQTSPDHPLAGQACQKRGELQMSRGRALLWQSRSPEAADQADELRNRARQTLQLAEGLLNEAHHRAKQEFNEFPLFIDRRKEPERLARRRQSEVWYVRAQLDLALCTYTLAHTYPEDAEEFRTTLRKASAECEEIHTKYRMLVGGLYARLWQAKCFEELNETGKALGICRELLAHPGQSATMQRLQDQALLFLLGCLNHEQQQNHELARIRATEWLERDPQTRLVPREASAESQQRDAEVRLGILFQRARAYEALGNAAAGNDPATAAGFYLKARTDAGQVARAFGEFQGDAREMLDRLANRQGGNGAALAD